MSDNGVLVLTGPPCAGKSAIGRALTNGPSPGTRVAPAARVGQIIAAADDQARCGPNMRVMTSRRSGALVLVTVFFAALAGCSSGGRAATSPGVASGRVPWSGVTRRVLLCE